MKRGKGKLYHPINIKAVSGNVKWGIGKEGLKILGVEEYQDQGNYIHH